MKRSLTAVALSLVAGIGCGPETRNYGIVVHNNSPDPVTLVLTKDGPPMEKQWLPPEDFAAMLHPPADWQVNGVVVPAGKTADQRQTGKFESDTSAILRVYRGRQSFERLLGIGPMSPNREDIPLAPGENTIDIDGAGHAERR